MSRLSRSLLAWALLPALIPAIPATAVERGELDRARQALESGEIVPLPPVLERLESTFRGQVVKAELKRRSGRWIYEVKLLPSSTRLLELNIDARSGTLLDDEEYDAARTRGGERERERESR